MAFALGAFTCGIVTYLVTLAVQSRSSRRNLESWGDILFVCAVPVTLLAVAWIFSYLGEGGRVSALATTEAMFESQQIITLPLFGFFAAGFFAPASVHVLSLKWRENRKRHDA